MHILIAAATLWCCVQARAGDILPPDISDIVRSMGELKDLTWGRLAETRKFYTNNSAALIQLNDNYIQASAAANSLIEQITMDARFAKKFAPESYRSTADRVKKDCDAFYAESKRLIESALPKQRGTATTPSSPVMDNAQKAVSVLDNVVGMIVKHRKSLRDLNAPQVDEFCSSLNALKWKKLDGSMDAPPEPSKRERPQTESGPRTNKLPEAPSEGPTLPEK